MREFLSSLLVARRDRFDENLRIASAGFVFEQAFLWQCFGSRLEEAAFLLEIAEGLGRKGEKPLHALLAREILREGHELAAIPLVLMRLADIEAGELARGILRINMQGHARDGRAVNFEKPIVLQPLEDLRAGTTREFLHFAQIAG